MIVTADHGGHARGHGTEDPLDMTIPWVIWGEGVTHGSNVTDEVRTMDTAATVLWMLGIEEPSTWVGRPVANAFTAAARVAAAAAIGAHTGAVVAE